MSSLNNIRDGLYLHLNESTSDITAESTVGTNSSLYEDGSTDDDNIYLKCISRFPHFRINNALLVGSFELNWFCLIFFYCLGHPDTYCY